MGRRKKTGWILLCILLFHGCGKTGRITEFPRNKTLCVGGFQWGPPTSFNPFAGQTAWPIGGSVNLVYESLFGFNQLTGQIEGLLADTLVINSDSAVVTLHPAARWNDGQPVTSADVVYTYGVHRTYNTPMHAIWSYLEDVRPADERTIVFVLNRSRRNPLVVQDILSAVSIVPQHVFGPREQSLTASEPSERYAQLTAWRNDSAIVGSGPYTLCMYNNQKIVLQRVENYWGNVRYNGEKNRPEFIMHMIYAGNDKYNLALQLGAVDVSQTFCPQISRKFRFGVGTWYDGEPYYIPGTIPCLFMALGKEPFSDVRFRRAIAYAIDYSQIRTFAMYNYSPPLKPGFILPFGAEEKFYSTELEREYGEMYDPEKARAMLKEAGYRWDGDGMLISPDGRKFPTMYATCPTGWTDWETAIRIAVTGMRAVGFDVREKFVEATVWDRELRNGLFDMTMNTPFGTASPSLPWSRFEKTMSSEDLKPVGEPMYQNQGRFSDPVVDSLIRAQIGLSKPEEIIQGYHALNRVFVSHMPVLPLMYRPWLFYQFNTKHWTNFPTEKNPYAPPQVLMVGAGVKALWEIRPAQ